MQTVTRGTLKRFEVYITDLEGNAQNPDTCRVRLIKQGEYGYDSPKGPYTCSERTTGYWYADVPLSGSMTLGSWVADFDWEKSGVKDAAYFNFIVVDMVRPYMNQPNLPPNVKIVG
jgi:hypothetical protein